MQAVQCKSIVPRIQNTTMPFNYAFQLCLSTMPFNYAFQLCLSTMPFNFAFQLCLSTMPFNYAFQLCLSTMPFNYAFQLCLSTMPFNYAFQLCLSTMPFNYAFQLCLSTMPFNYAFQLCLSTMPFNYAFQLCLSTMPFNYAFQLCLSTMPFNYAFQLCLSTMPFNYAFQLCLSTMPFNYAFQLCLSTMPFNYAFQLCLSTMPFQICFLSKFQPGIFFKNLEITAWLLFGDMFFWRPRVLYSIPIELRTGHRALSVHVWILSTSLMLATLTSATQTVQLLITRLAPTCVRAWCIQTCRYWRIAVVGFRTFIDVYHRTTIYIKQHTNLSTIMLLSWVHVIHFRKFVFSATLNISQTDRSRLKKVGEFCISKRANWTKRPVVLYWHGNK